MESSKMNTSSVTTRSSWLINRNFKFLFIGQSISVIGDQISGYTLTIWIVTIIAKGQSWAPLALGAVLIAEMLPNILVGPIAGVFVDRWKHQQTMLRMDGCRGFFMLLLILLTGALPLPWLSGQKVEPFVQLVIICLVGFLMSVCAQFFNPAYVGFIGNIIPTKERAHAIGLGQSMQAIARIIGPPLAAPLLITVGVQWALIINALSFVVSLVMIKCIKVDVEQESKDGVNGSLRKDFIEGLVFSFKNHLVRMLIITSTIAALGVGAFDSLYIFFIEKNLHADVRLSGIMGAMLGSGIIIGSLFTGKIAQKVGNERMLYTSLLILGCVITVISRLTNFVVAIPMFFLLGLVINGVRIATTPLLLEATPKNMIGRVIAVLNPVSVLANLIAVSIAAYLSGKVLVNFHMELAQINFGPIDTIFAGVGVIFCISALYASYSTKRSVKDNSDSLQR